MTEKILFSLENCIKCNQTKQLLSETTDGRIIQLPHNYADWSEEEKEIIQSYNIMEDLQRTAPILLEDGEKYIGFLRIKKWIQDTR